MSVLLMLLCLLEWCCAEGDFEIEVWDEEAEDGVMKIKFRSDLKGGRESICSTHTSLLYAAHQGLFSSEEVMHVIRSAG